MAHVPVDRDVDLVGFRRTRHGNRVHASTYDTEGYFNSIVDGRLELPLSPRVPLHPKTPK